jgi:hypothetical protein
MKPGRFLILRAQAVQRPGTERGTHELEAARVHLQERLRVSRQVGVHRAEEAQVVGVPGDLRKEFGDPQAALAVLRELPRRGEQLAGAAPAVFDGLAYTGEAWLQ